MAGHARARSLRREVVGRTAWHRETHREEVGWRGSSPNIMCGAVLVMEGGRARTRRLGGRKESRS
jgi:hypothetical protein